MGCRRSTKENAFADELADIAKGIVPVTGTITTVKPDETHPPVSDTTVEVHPVTFDKGPHFNPVELNTPEALFTFFKGCVEPGKVRKIALIKFLKGFDFRANKTDFVKYKLVMRQHKYSEYDLYFISRAINDACLPFRHTVNQAFETRVSKQAKEEAYWAQATINNFWLLLTNAIAQPSTAEFRNKDLYNATFEV